MVQEEEKEEAEKGLTVMPGAANPKKENYGVQKVGIFFKAAPSILTGGHS